MVAPDPTPFTVTATHMPSPRPVVQTNVSHFSINVDDMARARRFYERVFGWRFEAWGPPGFFMIATGNERDPGIHGSMQKRRELIAGERMTGHECSISVGDVDAVAAAVVANGGTILIPQR